MGFIVSTGVHDLRIIAIFQISRQCFKRIDQKLIEIPSENHFVKKAVKSTPGESKNRILQGKIKESLWGAVHIVLFLEKVVTLFMSK